MAQKVTGYIKLQIEAGKATPPTSMCTVHTLYKNRTAVLPW